MYRVIKTNDHSTSREEGDKARGVLFRLKEIKDEVVVFSGTSREEIELHARAYFYDNPNETLYLCDDANLVHEMFRHSGMDDLESRTGDKIDLLYGLLYVIALNSVAAVLVGIEQVGPGVPLLFAVTAVLGLLYCLVVGSKFLNSIEGGLLLTVVSVLMWVAWSYQSTSQPSQQAEETVSVSIRITDFESDPPSETSG